ncbi:MAG: hypothetical protein ACJ74W_19275 [Pyrinomonadaceae bacterium]
MSNNAQAIGRDTGRTNGATLDLRAEYQPDEAAQARALLLLLGLPNDEIERIVSELTLDSDREM